jgi:hypothetical protein
MNNIGVYLKLFTLFLDVIINRILFNLSDIVNGYELEKLLKDYFDED